MKPLKSEKILWICRRISLGFYKLVFAWDSNDSLGAAIMKEFANVGYDAIEVPTFSTPEASRANFSNPERIRNFWEHTIKVKITVEGITKETFEHSTAPIKEAMQEIMPNIHENKISLVWRKVEKLIEAKIEVESEDSSSASKTFSGKNSNLEINDIFSRL